MLRRAPSAFSHKHGSAMYAMCLQTEPQCYVRGVSVTVGPKHVQWQVCIVGTMSGIARSRQAC